jgi:hypothetical protein
MGRKAKRENEMKKKGMKKQKRKPTQTNPK